MEDFVRPIQFIAVNYGFRYVNTASPYTMGVRLTVKVIPKDILLVGDSNSYLIYTILDNIDQIYDKWQKKQEVYILYIITMVLNCMNLYG